MNSRAPTSFGAQLKALREAAGFTQEELATIAGLSVHAVSSLERGRRCRPQVDTLRALASALDLAATDRDSFVKAARPGPQTGLQSSAAPKSLPSALTPLVGRDTDIDVLVRWFTDPSIRLVTLLGPGGVGKTRLALEVAATLSRLGGLAAVFVGLASIREPAAVASEIAEALGMSDSSPTDLPARVAATYRGQPTVVVLDNYEHVLDAAPLVGDLLSAARSLRVLVTSRAPLRLRGEREYLVASLSLELDKLAGDGRGDDLIPHAVRLLVDRIHDVQADFELTPANVPTLTAICRRLDALPLAIELAAPWMKVLTPHELLRRLEDDILPPTPGSRDLPERQQTMNATVAWSYHLLSAVEQRMCRRLAALRGRFPIEAVGALMSGGGEGSGNDAALPATASLIEKSLLVRVETEGPRPLYRMLETIRAYTAQELAAAGERDAALEAVVGYCGSAAAEAAIGQVGLDQVRSLNRIREDLDCYRTALTFLLERGRAGEACEIAWNLRFFWLIRGYAREAAEWFQQCSSAHSVAPAVAAKAHAGGAVMWYAQGELARARAEAERSLRLSEEDAVTAFAHNITGYIELAVGNAEAARVCFEHSVSGFRRVGQSWGAGNALAGMAWSSVAAGDLVTAERLLDESDLALHGVGPWFAEVGLYVRAIVAVRRERPDAAIALIRSSLARIRDIQDRFALIYALVPLAAAAAMQGDDAWAARILGAREAVTERTGARAVDHSVRDLRENAERHARARLGAARWKRAYDAGRQASIDSLLHDIDSRRGE